MSRFAFVFGILLTLTLYQPAALASDEKTSGEEQHDGHEFHLNHIAGLLGIVRIVAEAASSA